MLLVLCGRYFSGYICIYLYISPSPALPIRTLFKISLKNLATEFKILTFTCSYLPCPISQSTKFINVHTAKCIWDFSDWNEPSIDLALLRINKCRKWAVGRLTGTSVPHLKLDTHFCWIEPGGFITLKAHCFMWTAWFSVARSFRSTGWE